MSVRSIVGGAVLALAVSMLTTVAGSPPASAAVTVVPVPTQGAGLGHIVTAPNGNMWFTETGGDVGSAVNQVGRITSAGQISEFALPVPPGGWPAGGPSNVVDIAAAPDSSVWVVYDSGNFAVHLDLNGSPIGSAVSLFGYPYGDGIVVAGDGTPWIAMDYDESGLARIVNGQAVWADNAPQCSGFLDGYAKIALGSDGTVWCQGGQNVIHSNADATGGTTYPLPADATYPSGLTRGPTGSLWITRRDGGTSFTPPSKGSIGVLDQATGQYQSLNLGSRTAPLSPVLGPDNRVWFANGGAAPAIGHVSADGHGAIHSVGNYHPVSLTFAADGAIWFTDSDANSIVRVLPSDLATTDIDLGDGSQLTPDTGTTPGSTLAGHLSGVKRPIPVKRHRVALRLACPKSAAKCAGRIVLRSKQKHPATVSRKRSYAVATGSKKKVKVVLNSRGRKLVAKHHRTRIQVRLYLRGHHKPAAKATITVTRRR